MKNIKMLDCIIIRFVLFNSFIWAVNLVFLPNTESHTRFTTVPFTPLSRLPQCENSVFYKLCPCTHCFSNCKSSVQSKLGVQWLAQRGYSNVHQWDVYMCKPANLFCREFEIYNYQFLDREGKEYCWESYVPLSNRKII